jgi:hypothetical protein
MKKNSFPPPSYNERRGYDLYDEVTGEDDDESKPNVAAALLTGLVGHAATILLYSAIISGLFSIARESRIFDWQISFRNLVTAVFLVQSLRIWDRAIRSRQR